MITALDCLTVASNLLGWWSWCKVCRWHGHEHTCPETWSKHAEETNAHLLSLQRFLPIAPAHDLFFIKPPEIIVPVLPRFRPYQPRDEVSLVTESLLHYTLCSLFILSSKFCYGENLYFEQASTFPVYGGYLHSFPGIEGLQIQFIKLKVTNFNTYPSFSAG